MYTLAMQLIISALLYITIPFFVGCNTHITTSPIMILLTIIHIFIIIRFKYLPHSHQNITLYPLLFCIWSFSIFSLFDWDVWWQEFPIPNIIGLYFGLLIEIIANTIFNVRINQNIVQLY